MVFQFLDGLLPAQFQMLGKSVDVIEAFKRLGKGYQTKINAALRKAIFN